MTDTGEIKLLDKDQRKIISKELDRLRKIIIAADQLEQCGRDCGDIRAATQALWTRYQQMLKHIYQESATDPPWQTTPQSLQTSGTP